MYALDMVKGDDSNERLSQSRKLGDRRTMNKEVAPREENCSLIKKHSLPRMESLSILPSGTAELPRTSDCCCLPSSWFWLGVFTVCVLSLSWHYILGMWEEDSLWVAGLQMQRRYILARCWYYSVSFPAAQTVTRHPQTINFEMKIGPGQRVWFFSLWWWWRACIYFACRKESEPDIWYPEGKRW